jgi:hypothetical protein
MYMFDLYKNNETFSSIKAMYFTKCVSVLHELFNSLLNWCRNYCTDTKLIIDSRPTALLTDTNCDFVHDREMFK